MYIEQYNMILIPILVLIFTRFIKFIIFYFKHGRNFEYTLKHAMSYGHMPSVHTALMVSLVASIGYYEGIASGAFAIAVGLAVLIVDDATRLRVYMGNLGRYINMHSKELKIKDKKEYPRLKERMGHRASEVAVGGIIGLLLTIIFINLLSF
ncbi:divergent PAP2 family protein [Patescibacteria group bacterium]